MNTNSAALHPVVPVIFDREKNEEERKSVCEEEKGKKEIETTGRRRESLRKQRERFEDFDLNSQMLEYQSPQRALFFLVYLGVVCLACFNPIHSARWRCSVHGALRSHDRLERSNLFCEEPHTAALRTCNRSVASTIVRIGISFEHWTRAFEPTRQRAMADLDVAPGRGSQIIKVVMPTYIMAPTEDERCVRSSPSALPECDSVLFCFLTRVTPLFRWFSC